MKSHHVNIAPIFLTFNAQPWIPVETKARLLEWKIRYDILQYAGRGAPDLHLDKIKAYQPKNAGEFSISSKCFSERKPSLLPPLSSRPL